MAPMMPRDPSPTAARVRSCAHEAAMPSMTRPAADGYPVPPPTMTDLYELTMAAGYWTLGRLGDEAIFTLFFRHAPFGGGFTLAAGLEGVVAFLESYRFAPDGARLPRGPARQRRPPAVRPRLPRLPRRHAALGRRRGDARGHGSCSPTSRSSASPGRCSRRSCSRRALLNLVNYPTLAATKAAHVVLAAGGAQVIEFGLRRAQGPDGGLTASRARVPRRLHGDLERPRRPAVRDPGAGHPRALWVLSFADEQKAFDAWADVMPGNAVLLVDTYDTEEGVAHAIETGRRLRERGQRLAGIRLDSGDLAYLSIAGARDARRRGLPGGRSRRVQRPRPRDDRVAPGPGRADRHVGRRHEARHVLRPARPGRGVQAHRDPRPAARGGPRSR